MITFLGLGAGVLTFLLERKLKSKGVSVMTKAKATATAKAKSTKKTPVKKDPVLDIVAKPQPNLGNKLAIFGEVCVKNIQLFSEKMAGIVKHIFTSMELGHGVNFINLDAEKTPMNESGFPIMAMLFPSTMTVTIYLQHHWKGCIDIILNDKENKMAIRALVWYNVLLSFFHELCHARALAEGLASGALKSPEDMIWTQDHEDGASLYAQNQLRELAKQVDTEIPADDPMFGSAINEFLKAIEERQESWAKAQRYMVSKGLVCSTETESGEQVDISSFKEFMRMSCLTDEEREDKSWNTNGTSFIINKDKMPEAIETIIPPPAATLGQPAMGKPDICTQCSEPTCLPACPINTPGQPAAPVMAQAPTVAPVEYGYNEYAEGGDEPEWNSAEGDFGYPDEGMPIQPAAILQTPIVQPAPLNQPVAPTVAPALVMPTAQPMTPAVGGPINPVLAALNNPNSGTAPQNANMPPSCPILDIPVEQTKAIVQTVLMRLFYHVFTKCGFNNTALTSFTNPGAVFDPVHIGDIPNANKIFLSMDLAADAEGHKHNDTPIVDSIKGQVFSNSGLPGYWLHLNVNGRKMKRTIVPQNPQKTNNNGALTPMALRVRNEGWTVMWVISEAYEGVPGLEVSKMVAKMECRPGQQPTFTWDPFKNK